MMLEWGGKKEPSKTWKRISNIEQGMSNNEVSNSDNNFIIGHSLFDIGYSGRNLPLSIGYSCLPAIIRIAAQRLFKVLYNIPLVHFLPVLDGKFSAFNRSMIAIDLCPAASIS